MNLARILGAALCWWMFAAPTAIAQTFNEVGDAGDLPATAQATIGTGSLTTIKGDLAFGNVDMYEIVLTGGATFSALAQSASSPYLLDPQLFLFDSTGRGVYAADDDEFPPDPNLAQGSAKLPAEHPLTPVQPGRYFLAISSIDVYPISGSGPIFPCVICTPYAVLGPTGSGGGSPITGWSGTAFTSGIYTIALTGAEFASPVQVTAVDGFDPGANNQVNAIAVQPDGRILVAGEFTTLGGGGIGATARSRIGRLNPDGSLDSSFDPGANGMVEVLAVQPDGKILVGGFFTMLGGGGTGTTTRNHIGRLNADGSLDQTFNPGVNGTVFALAVQADGKIVVGGEFTSLGGGGSGTTPRNNVGRLNADGSLDNTFNPGSGSFVYAVAVQQDGKILIGGSRVNADGSPDTSFRGANANGLVTAIGVQPDGKILVGGLFTTLGGGPSPTPRNRMGRLNADGSVDPSFDPGANDEIRALGVQPNGKILVAGAFTTLGGGGTGATTRNHLGRLNQDGSLDAAFDPGANASTYSGSAIAVQADGRILIGGAFTMLGGGGTGTTVRRYIGRLYGDGALDADLNPGANGPVTAMAVQADDKILVVGEFTGLGGGNGSTTRNHIGRLNPDGSLDPSFDPGASSVAYAVAVQPDGGILVGGAFTGLGGGTGVTTRNRIGRINADGSLDTTFDPGATAAVYALAVQADGQILVGGAFTGLGGGTGTTLRSRIGRLHPDGSLDMTFNPGAFGSVYALALQSNGQILVGGAFTTLGGGGVGTTARNSLGRLNPDGSLDPSFNPGANGPVYALAVLQDGKILVAGGFTTLGGGGTGTTTRNYIGRLNPDGSLDPSFDPGANSTVYVLATQTDGKILVGGAFTTLGGGGFGTTPRYDIGRINADGSLDTTFNPGANYIVHALAVQPDGKILAGGNFTGLGGGAGTTTRNYLGRLTNTDAALQGLGVTGGGSLVTWLRSGAGPDVWQVTFDASTDGVTYTSLGSGTRVANGWQLAGQSLATNQNLFIRARGYYVTTGWTTGSGSIDESIRNVFVSCPTIAPTFLVAGTAGLAYSTTFTATGAIGVVSFGETGTLPAGVTFSRGVLSGMPTQTGTFPLTVTATDTSSGCGASQNVTLTINCPTITLSTTSFADGTAGGAYANTAITQIGGVGTTTFAVTSGALPSGMTLSSAGVVSGTPTATGTFTFTVTAADANGCTGSRAYTLTIGCPTITLRPTTVANGAIGTAYSAAITQTGGVGTATFAVTSGSLPAGVTLSTAGALTGTPTASGTFNFTVTTTDANGCTGSRSYSLIVGTPTLALTPSTANFSVVNSAGTLTVATPPQTLTLTQTGGSVAWTAAADHSWITLSPTSGSGSGTLTMSINNTGGVLPASGSLTGTITVTPAAGADATALWDSASAGVGAPPWDPASAGFIAPTAWPANAPMTTVKLTIRAPTQPPEAPFGVFDTPLTGATIQGSIAVTGWALDDIGIDRVEIWRDLMAGEPASVAFSSPGHPGNGKVFIANPLFIAGSRPDVEAAYPNQPFANRAGWGYLLLTWGLFNQGNGAVTLYAIAFDQEGQFTTLGTKTLTSDNANATKPFGALDVPAYGETKAGLFFNFGWALTPNPNAVDSRTCTITNGNVFAGIDSGPLTTVDYGDNRTDIASAFPGFSNGSGGGGHYLVDTMTLANGVHQIGWYVVDSCGRADGIGSRFFSVLNGSSLTTATVGSVRLQPDFEGSDVVRVRRLNGDWTEVSPSATGAYIIAIDQSERIEVQLPVADSPTYTGAQILNGESRALPLGSSLDTESGIFHWHPAAGFLGGFDLVFTTSNTETKVRVVVGPSMRMGIDMPASGRIAQEPFTVAGWALDLAALDGTGIDTVHVWAYPSAGGDPVFLGVADMGDAQPIVAATYGAQFERSSFNLTATGLQPGTYEVVVYPHRAASGAFEGAQSVRVIVP